MRNYSLEERSGPDTGRRSAAPMAHRSGYPNRDHADETVEAEAVRSHTAR